VLEGAQRIRQLEDENARLRVRAGRTYRLYRLEGLQLWMKVRRRKRIALPRGKVAPAPGPNQHWSMDFGHDQMQNMRRVRILTVIDQ